MGLSEATGHSFNPCGDVRFPLYRRLSRTVNAVDSCAAQPAVPSHHVSETCPEHAGICTAEL
jgi:hypothetical protein